MHPRLCIHEQFELITNPFKYKCETYQILYVHFKKKRDECKMQLMSIEFNTFKMNDSTHV
jgi:hypothetical protein